MEVPPRNRRDVSAFDVGIAGTIPGADENEALPFASVYLWRHPDENTLFRAVLVAVYNEIIYTHSPDSWGPFELVATFNNYTVPVENGELIDGKILDYEKVYWGYVRPGIGVGVRKQVAPGHQDNMISADLIFEPGFLYFGRGSDVGKNFREPEDTFEARGRLQLRYDAMTRNLLELPHSGIAVGGDLIYGYRTNWKDWGTPGDRWNRADPTRDYLIWKGYAVGATAVPFLHNDRHRLIASVHGAVGDGVDRWSAPRVGGGPDPRGEEYGSTWRPVLPGAALTEFYPEKYVLATIVYRWEPIFFTYLGAGCTVGYLDRDRRKGNEIRRQDDVLTALSLRCTTGFLWESRLQLTYSYNFDVVRDSRRGGHELTVHISKSF